MELKSDNIWEDSATIRHSRLIADCYRYWTGQDIFPGIKEDTELSSLIYHAPFVVVSHGTEPDPIFNYANKKGQELWKLTWTEFTSMPSRLSAEPIEEATRNVLLQQGRERGVTFIEKGIRINKEGERFYIKDVVLFNLFTNKHEYLGQAAIYSSWEFIL